MKKLILGLRNRARIGGLRNWSALCLTAIVLMLVADRADQLSYTNYIQQVKSETRVDFLDLRQRTIAAIYARSLMLKELSTFVGENLSLTQTVYARRAQRILGSDKTTINLAAAPDLIVSLVHPMNGNSTVLGFNYRDSTAQFQVIQEMLQTGRETMAVPVDLVQGGKGIILRAPVYTSDPIDTVAVSQPWGIVAIVLDYYRFIDEVGIVAKSSSYDILIE